MTSESYTCEAGSLLDDAAALAHAPLMLGTAFVPLPRSPVSGAQGHVRALHPPMRCVFEDLPSAWCQMGDAIPNRVAHPYLIRNEKPPGWIVPAQC